MEAKTAARFCLAVLFAVPPFVLVATDALALKASFSWAGIPACEKISPAFNISDAPAETKALRFKLHDNDAPYFHHGGSTVAYTGAQVPQGAIAYVGPCPPPGQQHHYVWTVEALDARGDVIDRTTAAGNFPPR